MGVPMRVVTIAVAFLVLAGATSAAGFVGGVAVLGALLLIALADSVFREWDKWAPMSRPSVEITGAPVDPVDRERDLIVTNRGIPGTYSAVLSRVRDANGQDVLAPCPWVLGWNADLAPTVRLLRDGRARLRLIMFDTAAESNFLAGNSCGDSDPYPFTLLGAARSNHVLEVLIEPNREWNVLLVTVRVQREEPQPAWEEKELRLSFKADEPTEMGAWAQPSGL
jgi:hypothetical protein